jgi:hypothetical protein
MDQESTLCRFSFTDPRSRRDIRRRLDDFVFTRRWRQGSDFVWRGRKFGERPIHHRTNPTTLVSSGAADCTLESSAMKPVRSKWGLLQVSSRHGTSLVKRPPMCAAPFSVTRAPVCDWPPCL